jgi:hypothetical protein
MNPVRRYPPRSTCTVAGVRPQLGCLDGDGES